MLEKLSSAGISGLRWVVSGPMEEPRREEDGFGHELDVEPQRETVMAWADRIQRDFASAGSKTDVFHGLEPGATTRTLLEAVADACADRSTADAASLGYTFGLALGLAVERTAATRVMDRTDVVKEAAVRIRQHDTITVPNQFVLAMYKSANDHV